MTKVKLTKPSATLLASRRAKEKVTIPKDYALKSKMAFIRNIDPFPNFNPYKELFWFYIVNLFTGKYSHTDRVKMIKRK